MFDRYLKSSQNVDLEKILQVAMFDRYLIARPDDVRMSKLLKEQL